MARSFVASSSQYLSGGIGSVTPGTDNLSLSVLCYPTASTGQVVAAIVDPSNANRRFAINRQASDAFQFTVHDGSTAQNATSTGSVAPSNAWYHVAASHFSTTNRNLYIDGVFRANSTVLLTMGAVNTASVAARANSTPAAFFDGRVAWMCVRNTALTESEFAQEAATRNPFAVRPETIIHFWQLWGDGNEIDLVGGVALTPTNSPAKVDHPWITEQRPTLWLPYSAPPSDDRTATGALTASAQTLSGSAAHDAPEFTATAALTASSQTLSGEATFADLPTRFGEGALETSPQTLSGSATHTAPVFEATGALSASSQTLAGTATFNEQPAFSATGSLVASSQTLSGDATFVSVHTASGALQASPQTLSGDATHTAPASEATGTLTASAQSLSGTAIFAAEIFTATGVLATSSQTLSGTATATAPEYDATGGLVVTSQVLAGVATFTPGVEPLPPPVTADAAVADMMEWWAVYVQMVGGFGTPSVTGRVNLGVVIPAARADGLISPAVATKEVMQ